MSRKDTKKEAENLEYPEQKIVDIQMEKEVKKSFLNYSMSVIVSRALPDARDGLKPVHRRILYAMYEDHLTYDRPFRKSATTVGNVLGRYHPHGDVAVYDSMVRLAQDFSLRYPLIEGHGNFGDIDGAQAAAYRYTEARMSKIADEMLTDIEKDVVNFIPNFDNKLKEPEVLPSRFPNMLVNGSMGIAVGMATNIPPHNLGEVIDGTVYLIDHPDAGVNELMAFIKGPDFPTGAIICGKAGIQETYATGKGKIIVRGRAEIEEEKHRIVITEIPYGVNKAMMVETMANCVKDKRIEGITGLRDESGRDGLRVVVDYKHDANGTVILNQLYKYTQLQDTCAANINAIVNGRPEVLPLKRALQIYIGHQEEVTERRIRFDLEKALKEMHIFEGYKIALDNIDKVISIIRSSPNVEEAKINLINAFKTSDLIDKFNELGDYESASEGGLSDAQASAIVAMTLGRLSGLERDKIEARLADLAEIVKGLRYDLTTEGRIQEIIKNDLIAIKNKFADPRRTEIAELENEIAYEDLIDRHTCVITMTHQGYIKRQNNEVYSAQRRGGKGIIGMTTKEEDFVEQMVAADTHSTLLLFTNTGKVYSTRAFRIPETSRTAKGTNIVNIIDIGKDEKVTTMIAVDFNSEDDEDDEKIETAEVSAEEEKSETAAEEQEVIEEIDEAAEEGTEEDKQTEEPQSSEEKTRLLMFVTRFGIVKRVVLDAFRRSRKGGKAAVTLDEGDELIYVRLTTGKDEVLIATHLGNCVRFSEKAARVMGRTARGVRGIRLNDGDFVTGVTLVENDKKALTITEKGYGKLAEFSDFITKNRGGKGVCCHKLSDKTGYLAGIATAGPDDDVMLITSTGTIIRVHVADIPTYGRAAGGVIVMRTGEEGYIYNFALVPGVSEDEEETGEGENVPEPEETASAEETDN